MTKCPKCSKEFSENTVGGLCPACLLQQGLESQAGVTAGPGAATLADPGSDRDARQAMSPEKLMALLPQFDQIELIGRGGMGVVYKARQKNLDRLVALKVLLPEGASSRGFAERFAREARAMARLSHPNIVAVHDFGCVDNSGVELCYFSMEFVDGSNLRGLIKQLSPSQALAIVPQICEALQYAHDIGIIHRDIKPENILVDKKGRVKIADFGLAKLLQQARSPSDYTLTQAELVMGTPSYMAPEQRERPTEVDHRADLYSLGVVFYEMLTGQLPKGRFPLPSQRVQIDVRFDEVVLKALEHDRELRYQHASEVRTSVESVRSTPGTPGAPTSQERASSTDQTKTIGDELTPGQPAPLKRRFRIWYFLLSTVIFTAAFFAALALWNLRWPGVALGGVVIFVALGAATALGDNFRILLAHWKTDTPIKAVVRFAFCLTCCVGGYYFVLGGTFADRERNLFLYRDTANFVKEYTGKEYQLLRLLPSYQHTVPQVELTDAYARPTYASFFFCNGVFDLSTYPADINFRLFLGFWLLASGVVMLFVGGGRMLKPKRSWRVWIWPATLLLAIIVGWWACGVIQTCLGFIQLGGTLSGGEPVKSSLNDLQKPLQACLMSQGYAPADMNMYSMNRIPDGEKIGVAGVENFVKPSPFDRWRWTRGKLVPNQPAVQLFCVTTAWQPPNSYGLPSASVGAPHPETYVMWTIYGTGLDQAAAYGFNDQLHALVEATKTAVPATGP